MPSKSIDHAFTASRLTGAATDPTHAGALSFMRRKYTKSLDGVVEELRQNAVEVENVDAVNIELAQ